MALTKNRYRIAVVDPTPNWHHPELYARLSESARLEPTVYFCNNDALNGRLLAQTFGVTGKSWGEDLLGGYNSKFLKNFSPIRPSFKKNKLGSCMNPGIIAELNRTNFDAVIIGLWNDLTFWLTAVACQLFGRPLFVAGDSTILTERSRPYWLRKIKSMLLGKVLFRMASGILYRSEASRQFYRHYGVPESKLFSYPLTVDQNTYYSQYLEKRDRRSHLRKRRGIPDSAFVILFAGRLSEEKRPKDLISAFLQMKTARKYLLFVGDGRLMAELENDVKLHGLKGHVQMVGFKPRHEVLDYYAIADVLVLPSDFEPHGDVVKEAMCFGAPVVVSDKVGASMDVVRNGENGFVYPCGDVRKLADCIDALAEPAVRETFREKALETAEAWDHQAAVDGLLHALDCVHGRKR